MAKVSTNRVEDTSDRELVTSRVFDAPRELVWKAWTDPKLIVKWWGPIGFTTTSHGMDVKVGGGWKLTMHGPDGRDYPNEIRYIEIVKPERLVYTHIGDGGIVSFRSTVTFEAEDNKTKVTMRGVFPSKEALQFVIKNYGADKGAKETLGRLADILKEINS